MIHKLLCKLGIHRYEERVHINYCCNRKISGNINKFERRIKDYEVFYKCRYCGKRKEENKRIKNKFGTEYIVLSQDDLIKGR